MKLKQKITTSAQLSVILLTAYAVKSFYSTAGVNDLRWILAPTAVLVELITGKQFTFESQAGYISADHTFLIAASCSGVNFLIISFLVLALGKIWRERPTEVEWRFLPIAAAVAYVSTLAANTTRIVVALYSQNVETSWFDHDELHRVQGIVIYFGFLLALFAASERFASRSGRVWNSPSSVSRRSAYVLAIYYAVTLGIPILRGSYRESAFWQHSIVVVAIPIGLTLLFAICRATRNTQTPSAGGKLP
ncbi:MAG TPA: exosortase K [Pyrinomonadaceae bacterium]|nr:exosortase K [Pyrinomonadaceae bacterium]